MAPVSLCYQALRQRSSTLRSVTEVTGAGAYAALLEFERITRMIPIAPELPDRIELAGVAAGRQTAFQAALDRSGPVEATFPQLDEAMRRTEPRDWWEGLIAVCLWSPLLREVFATDFAADLSAGEDLPGPLGIDAAWAESRLRPAVEGDPTLAARLLLQGRRLVGAAIVLAREFSGDRYPEQAERLAEAHTRRLRALLPSPESE
jgi:tRNA-(MS[2]IO[6]A)-hydroxylase (MiaE)-like